MSDTLVAENASKYYGELITEFLIEKLTSDMGSNYYRLVSDDYELYELEP